jgi:hypothetical protein
MIEEKEKIPLDAKLISDIIIELNISRRNVAIYPKDHPSVEKSLNRAYEYFKRLFEIRPEITIAIAKDTFIIDDYYLDRKNPVYKELASHLNKLNIIYITFLTGLSLEELYEFHKFISGKISELNEDELHERLKESNLIHIKIGFIDYSAFSFTEGETLKNIPKIPLWEKYVYGLLEGTLQPQEINDEIKEIPPEILAQLLNRSRAEDLKEETYDKVITSYVRKSAESAISSNDLKRLLSFINGLRPELKSQFLTSAIKNISKDIDSIQNALKEITVDELMVILETINEQKVLLPESLKNLLDKLSGLPHHHKEDIFYGGNLILDDIFLSPDLNDLLQEGKTRALISDNYQKEIQKLLNFDFSTVTKFELKETTKEFEDESIEKSFNLTLLELISNNLIVSDEDYKYFLGILSEQIEQFLWTGSFYNILKSLNILESNIKRERFIDITKEYLSNYHNQDFINKLVESIRIFGRHKRDDVLSICKYYGKEIVPSLMDSLTIEESQIVRKLLITILIKLGEIVIPEAIKRLADNRWYVKRNMLYILSENNTHDVLPHVRLYCRYENRKVSFEAIKCLLNAGDRYAIEAIRDYLNSDSKDDVLQAITLIGSYKIQELVPELIRLLKKKGFTGADLYDKIPIVKALGDIGDIRALDVLKDLLLEKSILYKGAAEKLKEEIFRTLKNYPISELNDFIEFGLRSKNNFIKNEARRLKITTL